VLEKNVYDDQSDTTEGVVLDVRVRAPVNNSELRTTIFEIALHAVFVVVRQSFTAFFP
jgi:hypothetical protein